MKKQQYYKIGIVLILVFIVSASGCISPTSNETKTFSDGVMSFNYPEDFHNDTYSENTNSSMQLIGKLKNTIPFRMHDIAIFRNTSTTSPTQAREGVISVVKNMSTSEISSIATETNPNGIVIEKTTFTYEYTFGMRARFNDMFFKINDTVYVISVYGPDTTTSTQNIMNTANIIFQSIK